MSAAAIKSRMIARTQAISGKANQEAAAKRQQIPPTMRMLHTIVRVSCTRSMGSTHKYR